MEFEIFCYRLRILIRVDIDDLEPAHLENVYAIIPVWRTVDKGIFCGPPHDDRGVMRQHLHPDVMDGKNKPGGRAYETLEP